MKVLSNIILLHPLLHLLLSFAFGFSSTTNVNVNVKGRSKSNSAMQQTANDSINPEIRIRIRAERCPGTTKPIPSQKGTSSITKLVHFQRHGEGYHNLLGDVLRTAGVTPSVDSFDPAINPWLRPEIVDSPLTETGKDQCRNQCELASKLTPELVIVSPLLRALQTAKISFGACYPTVTTKSIPWIAHEGCREETGVLVCNKRRPLSQIVSDYPEVQFEAMTEEDSLFNPSKRETGDSKSKRINEFLKYLMARPENEIAVIGHSAWLFHMLNEVVEVDDADDALRSWFTTSEIRSIQLTFYPPTQ